MILLCRAESLVICKFADVIHTNAGIGEEGSQYRHVGHQPSLHRISSPFVAHGVNRIAGRGTPTLLSYLAIRLDTPQLGSIGEESPLCSLVRRFDELFS